MVLEKALKRATTDKGVSYLSLNNELAKAGTSADKLVATLASGGPQFAASLNAANNALALSNRQVISLNAKLQEMSRVLVQSFKFTAAQTFLRQVSSQAREAYRWVEDLNSAVNQIAVVTGKTDGEMEKITQAAIKGSKELRVAAQDYAEGALIFYQQGLNDEEVTRRNEITIKAAKAAGSSIETMASQLTAIWNTYGMAGEEQLRAASVGAKMAAQTAVDFSDIAEAMQSAAAPAAQMGVEYNQLAAIIATVGDVTQQSASTIGNAYKTIFSRFQQLKSDGTDGEVTLSSVSRQLEDMGIHVLDAAGNLRDLGTVINEVGNNWDNWTQTQQTAIAQIVGGTRQYGQFLALMQNFDKYQANLKSAEGEDGSTLEQQYKRATDTIESYAENASEAWNRAFSNMFPEDLIKGVYKTLEGMGNLADSFIKSMGGFPGIMSMAAALLANKIVPSLMNGARQAKIMMQNMTPEGREKNIKTEYRNQREAIQRERDASGNNTDRMRDLGGALAKSSFGEQTALINDKINTQLKTATGEYKIQLEWQKKLLESAQNQYQNGTDTLVQLGKQVEAYQDIATQEKLRAEAAQRRAEAEHSAAEQAVQDTTANLLDKQRERDTAYQNNLMAEEGGTEEEKIAAREALVRAEQDLAVARAQAEAATQRLATAETELSRATDENKMLDSEPYANVNKHLSEAIKMVADLRTENIEGGAAGQKAYDAMGSAIDEVINAISEASGAEGEELDGLTEEAERLHRILDKISNAGSLEELEDIRLDEGIGSLEEIINHLTEMADRADLASQAISDMNEQLLNGAGDQDAGIREQDLARRRNEDPTPPSGEDFQVDWSGYLTGLTQVVSAAVMAQNAVLAFWDAWNDDDSTGIDKIMSIAATLPQLGLAISTIGSGVITIGKALGITGEQGLLAGLKTQAGFAPFLPLLYAITAAVLALVAVFAILDTARKLNIKRWEEEVDQFKKEIDSTNELSNAVNENTKAVEENINAWRSAVSSGTDATETYDAMVESLNTLNESLVEAGANSQELNRAMTQALATGELDQYYEIARKQQAELFEQQMEQYKKLNFAQVQLAKAQMANTFDFDGPEHTTISTTEYGAGYDAQGNYSDQAVVIEPSQALKNMAKESNLFSESGGTITLDLEFKNAGDFRQQYKNLVQIRKELENTGAKESELAAIDKQIEGMTENFEALESQVKEAKAALEDMISSSLAFQMDQDNFNLDSMTFADQTAYLNSMFEIMKQQGLAIGMSMEEVEQSFRGIVAGVPELNSALASLDQVGVIAQNVLRSGSGGFGEMSSEAKDQMAALNKEAQMLQDTLNTGATKTGIGRWLNGLSAEEEYIIDTLDMTKEEVQQRLEDINEELANVEIVDLEARIAEQFNGLSKSDRGLLLKAGVEFVDDEEDIQQILDNMKDLDLKVNIKFKNEDELRAEINKDNNLQDGMEPAIKEFQKTGMVSVDTARQMIDSGLSEYLMVVNDHFVLTTGAANAYNSSLEREKDNTQALLEVTTELRAPAQSFAESMAVLRATMDNDILEDYAQGLEDISVEFLNSEGSAQDMIKYFNGMKNSITGDLQSISGEISNLTENQMHQLLSSFESIGTNLADVMAKANNAAAQGQITMDEYREALMAAGQVQREASEAALSVSQERLSDTIADVNKQLGLEGDAYIGNMSALKNYIKQQRNAADATDDQKDELDGLTDALNAAQDEYDGIENSISDFDDAMSDMEAMETWVDTVTENFEALQGILDDDFSLKINLEDLDTSQLEVLKTTIQSALDSISGLSEEAMGRVTDSLFQATNSVDTFVVNGTEYTREGLTTALKNHEITAEDIMKQGGVAAEAILQATATENEKTIQTAGQAIGGLMEAVGNLISDFEANITVGIKKANLSLNPSWSGAIDLGKKLIAGEKVSVKPEGSIEFSISGGLTGNSAENFKSALNDAASFFNTSDAGGLSDGMPSLSDYNTKTPTAAMPSSFNTPEGTGNGKSGGSKEKEFKKQEENDLKREKERYVNINSTLSSLEKTLDKVSAAEEDAWGVTKLRNLRMMNRLLGEQNQLLSRKYKEAQDYYHSDIANLGADATFQRAGLNLDMVGFNADGTISNRENLEEALWQQIVQPILDQENALKASYNASGVANEAAEKAIEEAGKATSEAKKNFDEALKLMDKVDDSANTMAEVFKQLVENVRAAMNRLVEYIRQKLDIHIRVDERDLRRLEQLIDRFGDLGVISGEAFNLYAKSMETQVQKMNDIMAAMKEGDDLLQHVREIDVDDPDRYTKGFGADFVKYFGLNEDSQKALDEYLKGNGQMPAEILDFLVENRDALEEGFEGYLDTALDQLDTIFQRIENWLDEVYQSIDTKLDYNESVLDYYQNALDFKGTNYIQAEGREAQRALMDGRMSLAGARVKESVTKRNDLADIIKGMEDQLTQSKTDLANAKSDYEEAKKAREKVEAARREIAKSGNKAAIEEARIAEKDALSIENAARLRYETAAASANAFEQQLKEYRQQYAESAAEIVRSQEEIMQAMKDNIEQEKALAKGQFAVVLNGLFSDISDMRSMYDTIKAEKDYILDDYDKNYNIDKLQRSFDEDLEANNYTGEQLQKLMEWQEKLNTYKEEGKNMTQDEADLMAKQLEILQAKAQLEDEMTNKNTMRLQRDASGNYSYVYSSDASAAGDDQTQKIKDLEYEYKKMLEGVQDKAADTMMDVAEQVIEFADSVNWQLYQSSELYRRSVDVKMNSLINLLDLSSQEATQVFDQLNAGVGIWDANWAEHAGGILTQTENVQDAFQNIRDALVGENGYEPGSEDTSTYFGAIMSGQHYWATEATEELKNATESLADEDKGIPHDFHLVTEAITGEVTTICGPNGSLYQTLHVETQALEENIRKVLLNGEGGDQNVEHDWNELELAIAEAVGIIVNTDLDNLKNGMDDLKDSTGTTLQTIIGQFQDWRTQTNAEIQAVIDKLKEYLGLVDQYENQNNDDTYNEPTASEVIKQDVPTATETPVSSSVPITTAPGGGSGSGAGGGTLSQGEIAAWAYSGGNHASGWADHPEYKSYKGIQSKVSAADFEKIKEYAHSNEYYQNVGGSGWASVLTKYGMKKYTSWSQLISDFYKYDTGGYTGDWGTSEGKVAMLHEKELVLNKEDTENILKAVSLMRQTVAAQFGSINGSLAGTASAIVSQAAQTPAPAQSQAVDQQVHIEASFPGVSVAQEIEDALNSLITQAAQYNIKT